MPDTAQLKEQLEHARLKRQLAKENALAKLQEGWFSYTGSAWGDWVDPRDRYADAARSGRAAMLPGPSDIKKGSDYIAFRDEAELFDLQAWAAYLHEKNVYCQGAIGAIQDKIIGTAFSYRPVLKKGREAPDDLLVRVADFLNEWDDLNDWPEWEGEVFERTRVAGEAFERHFVADGNLLVRSIEPQQILNPSGANPGPEWAYGVRCSPRDQQSRIEYFVSYDCDASRGECVPASEIHHYKINTRRIVRRGLSDFFSVDEIANQLHDLLLSMAQGAGLLAKIAWIEQYAKADKAEVEAFADDVAQYTYTDQETGSTKRIEHIDRGTVIRTGSGKTYAAPPLATGNAPQMIEIGRMARQALATRWRAPETLFGDASNGTYASLSIAESPFVAFGKVQQAWYGRRFRRTKLKAIAIAVRYGRLPPETLNLIDIAVEPPMIEVRDRAAQAATNQILRKEGILSPYTWAQAEGRDLDEEIQETQRARDAGWQPEAAPAMGLPAQGPGPALGDPAPADAPLADAAGAGADAAGALRATVGGSTAIAALQRSYYSGEIPRDAAIANALVVFGFAQEEAERLFPEQAPTKLTADAPAPAPQPTTEGRIHGPFASWRLTAPP